MIGGHLKILNFFQNNLTNLSLQDSNGMTALHCAAQEGQLQAVKYLSEFIDCNIKDNNGTTALDIAKSKDFQSVIDYLNWLRLKPETPTTEKSIPDFAKPTVVQY